MRYKILKRGYFAETCYDKVGATVEMSPDEARPIVEAGYIEEEGVKEEVKATAPKPKAKPRAKAKKKK